MQRSELPRVLLADPSANIVERLATSIVDVAQVVGRAINARDALAAVRNAHPHLAVLDIAIANGVELLRQIKNQRPNVIVVVLTHCVEDETRRLCQRLGAEFFLDKNDEFDQVRKIVIAISSGWGRMASVSCEGKP